MELFEYKENKLRIDGIELFYKTAGSGEPLLILHGWGASSVSWTRIIEEMAGKEYELIVPDLPGFGKTLPPEKTWGNKDYAEFIVKFLEKLNMKDMNVLGHSFGGGIALRLAAEHDKYVKKLILNDAAIIRKINLNFRQKVSRFLSKIGSKISIDGLYPVFSKIVYAIAGNYDYYNANPRMKEIFKKIVNEDLTFLLHKVRQPTLVVWGENDLATPLNDALKISDSIKDSELRVLAGVGHNCHRTDPGKLAKIIINFLNK